ncbi:DNA-deoxyinosine glycosylase [Microbulbifer sp. TRSA001]|uniref:DNA-deoxyinosine glycosylase n=1 Tax=Microbulbifer sp. TRSA001 TaxID=3243381 RepID=UPI004039A982
MSTIAGFSPIADKASRILILGSMPSELSLEYSQYYANPRNAFWNIMAGIVGFSAELPYEARIKALKASGIALWDVLHTCVRSGSLDSSIKSGTRVPNDFQSFFEKYQNICKVGFNGVEAEESFNTYVKPNINCETISFVRLPSSSSAYAVTLENKIEIWQEKLTP